MRTYVLTVNQQTNMILEDIALKCGFMDVEDYILNFLDEAILNNSIKDLIPLITKALNLIEIDEIFTIKELLLSVTNELPNIEILYELEIVLEKLVLKTEIKKYKTLEICSTTLLQLYIRIL